MPVKQMKKGVAAVELRKPKVDLHGNETLVRVRTFLSVIVVVGNFFRMIPVAGRLVCTKCVVVNSVLGKSVPRNFGHDTISLSLDRISLMNKKR